MKKSYKSILLLFVVMILAISAVNAAEIDDTSDSAVQAVDEAAVDEVASTDVDDVVATDDSADVLADSVVSGKNFTTLQSDIDEASGYIALQSDYLKESGEGVVTIAKDITINGDNHKIDANKNGGIFKIESGYSVTLMNVILINGNTEKGGAIYNDGSLNFISSQISDSNASVGGAIYNTGILTISSGSTLDGNTATTLGGAVYNEGTAIADQAIFTNNKVTTASYYNPGVNSNGGAAIFTAEGSRLDVDKSTFTGNSAPHDTFAYFTSGGAIYVYKAATTTIDDCTFENNDAGLGGAIIFEGFSQEGIAVQNSVFNSNQAWQGAAINVNEFVGNLNIAGNNFTGNAAVGPGLGGPSAAEAYPASGGAVSIGTMQTTGTTVEITDCDFTQNTAEGGAGAISINANTEVAIENCDFIKNEASYGSAIVSAGTANVNGSRFKENKGNLGTVYLSNSANSITNSNFTQNDDAWGEILNYAGELTLENNEIDNAGAGIVSWGEGSSIVTNMKVTILGNDTYEICQDTYEITAVITDDAGNIIRDFVTGHFKFVIEGKETVATYDNGVYKATCDIPVGVNLINAIYTEQDELTVETSVIRNIKGTFTDLQAKIDDAIENNSGVLDLTYNFTYNADIDGAALKDGIVISQEITIDGNGTTISGANLARIFNITAKATLKNVTFVNGSADKGGAIYNGADLTVVDSVFEDNKAAGCSYAVSRVDCTGGAAIYAAPGSSLNVTGTTFKSNSAPHASEVFSAGGAIYVNDANLLVSDSTFEDNSAVYGGAIMFENFNQDTVAIKDSVFNNNTAWQGGAINGNDFVGSLIITGSNFTGNKAVTPNAGQSSPCGGAIMVGTKSYTGIALDIDGCNFEDNSAVYMGGAIASSPDNTLKVANSNFTNNSATSLGGAIVTGTGTELTVSGSNFTDNKVSATGMGGAIFCEPGSTNDISDSTFTNNIDRYSSAIMSYQGTLELADNIFDDNGVFNYAGTITSEIKAIVLNNETVYDDTVTLTAKITDDNDNVIRDSTFQFVINGEPVTASYNTVTKLYQATYTLPALGVYPVTITSTKNNDLTIKTGAIKNVKGTFTALNYLIKDATEVNLTGNFTYDEVTDGDAFVDGIVIDHALTINGNGYTINGNNVARIFNVTAATTLNNVTFVNGSADKGGAIYNGADLTVVDSVFEDNKAAGCSYAVSRVDCTGGAAIYAAPGSSLNVTGTTFKSNSAPHASEVFSAGGAIYVNDANLLVSDSTFEDNSAVYGGAIMFENFNQDTVAIKDSVFNNNTAWQGGAINGNDFVGSLIITGSNFTGNKAVTPNAGQSSPCGGAIMVGTKSYTGIALDIDGCNFEDNSAVYMGGAIASSPDNTLKVANSNFTNNSATSLGGAIVTGTGTELTVSGSNFTDNKVSATGMGGAIFCEPNSKNNITGSTFTNNVDRYSSAIMSYQGTLDLTGNTFNGPSVFNYAGTITSKVYAVVLSNKTVTTSDNKYTLNATLTDDNGNFIRDSTLRFVVNGVTVATQPTYINGLYVLSDYPITTDYSIYLINVTSSTDDEIIVKTGTIENLLVGTFTDLQAKIDDAIENNSGVLDLTYNFTYNADIDGAALKDGIVISQEITIDGNGTTISGANLARIFNITAKATLKNVTFVNGSADKGGAIYNGADLTVVDSVFEDNKAAGCSYAVSRVDCTGGAAIYAAPGSSLNVTGTTFKSNSAPHASEVFSAGGAIYVNDANLLVSDSTFEDNSAVYGGAIMFENFNQDTVAIKDSVFNNNTAWQGGAINGNDLVGSLIITGSNFTGNKAVTPNAGQSSPCGGAIMVGTKSYTGIALDIDGCNFEDNSAVYMGGAIASSPDNTLKVANSNFTNNSATSLGGAIVTGTGTELTVSGSNFTDNKVSATGMGGAIFCEPNSKNNITGSTFTNNVDRYSSAIMSYQGTLDLTGNTFNGPSVFNYAGTITSKVFITLIGGQNITAALGEVVTPNATLTDDNGNIIRDSTLKITVGGQELPTSYADGLYTATYTIADAGDNVVNTTYDATVITGIYKVDKANATLTVTVEDIIDGQNATVFVTLTGVNGIGLNDTVTVIVNNKEYPIVVTNGTGNETIKNLTHGSYPVVAMLNESANYNKAINSTVFYVKASTTIVIEGPADNVTYGEPVTIKVTVTTSDNQPFNGLIHLGYYETDYDVVIHAGEGSYTFDANTYFLGKGEHEFIAVYDGDNDYNASVSNKVSFTVKAENITDNVTVTFEGYSPDPVTVTVVGPYEGTYNVTVDGQTVQVDIKYDEVTGDIRGNATISGLETGVKTATIVIDDENYALNITEEFTYENKKSAEIIIEVSDSLIGNSNHALITVNGDENISVIVNGNVLGEDDLWYDDEEGVWYADISSDYIVEGENNISVTYPGDESLLETTVNKTFTAYDNVVTKDNFFVFFDEEGVLLYVPFDELIFKGEFENLVDVITLDSSITIIGEDAKLTDIGFKVTAEDVTLSNLDITYNAPATGDAIAISVEDASGFNLIDSNITYIGNVENLEGYQYALRVANSDNAVISGNKFDVALPTREVDWYGVGIGQDLVLAIGVQGGDNVQITKNTIDTKCIGVDDGNYPTLDTIMVDSTTNLEISYNNITQIDTVNTGSVNYYAVDLYSFTGIVDNNNILVNTTTGIANSGTAYPIQMSGAYSVTVSNNNLTAISNGPTLGIQATNWGYLTAEATIIGNTINVTGLPTDSAYGLVSGMELQINNAYVYYNTIYAQSNVDYDDANSVYGISFAQYNNYFAGEYTQDIKDNTIYSQGKYAIFIAAATNSVVENNYLIAHELYGDSAVNITEGNTVEANYPQDLNITVSADNVTVDSPVVIKVTTNALFTGNLTLTIGEDTYDVEITDGVGSYTLPDLAAKDYEYTVSFVGYPDIADDLFASESADGKFTVSKYDSIINITAGEPVIGQELVVTVTVPTLTGDVIVVVDNGAEQTLALNEGTGTYTISKATMTPGKHNVTVIVKDNDKYADNSATYNFTVDEPTPIDISVSAENVTVDSPVVIKVTTNTLFTGNVTLLFGNEEIPVEIIEGVGSHTLTGLAADDYEYNVTYVGYPDVLDLFTTDSAVGTFTVSKYETVINITAGEPVIDEDFTVSITIPTLDGNVTVIGVDGTPETVTLTAGTGTYTVPKAQMTAGDHSITVIVKDNAKYADNSATYNFTVEKAEEYEFDVNITVDEINAGENVTFNVTLPEDANGTLDVYVNEELVDSVKPVNGTATVTIPADKFVAGMSNDIEVEYTGDAKYDDNYESASVYVNKLESDLSASAANITIGENATVIVTLPTYTDGDVYIILLGERYDVIIKDGKGNATIENLTEGTYTASVVFEYDSIYKYNETEVTFKVSKVEIPAEEAFNITTPENSTSQVISVELPEDATGYLLLDVDGKQTFVPLVNGKANVTVPNLAEGTYNATITYTGDDKYDSITTTKEINVTSNVPDNALTIPDSAKSDAPTTYSINLPSDATGYLEVDVDGTKYVAPLVNGSASVTIPALSEGNHNVTVKYTGDDKYSPVTKSTTLAVTAPVYKITNNKNVAVIYSATASYKVLVTRDGKAVGAGESVAIKYNGKTYTVKTDSKGYATLKLNTKVKVKKYTITATYKGKTVKNTVTVKHLIKAKNIKIKKSKKVNKIKVKTNKVNGKFLKGKKLTLKIKGKKVKAKINKKGVATFKLKKKVTKKLKAGKKYKYTVSYGKDKVVKKAKVKK